MKNESSNRSFGLVFLTDKHTHTFRPDRPPGRDLFSTPENADTACKRSQNGNCH